MSKKSTQGSFVTSTKELFYKTLGKVETSEDSQDFKEGNEEYKKTLNHFKTVNGLNQKYQKSCQNFSSVEKNISQELIDYAQTVQYVKNGTEDTEDPYEKSRSELSLILQTMGATLEYISVSRQKMATEIQEGFFENVSDLIKDIERCEETKKNYKQYKLENDIQLNKFRTIKNAKTVDQVKLEQASEELETIGEELDSFHKLALDEFEYVKKRRDIDYSNYLRRFITGYQNNIIETYQILQEVKNFLVIPETPPIDVPEYLGKEEKENLKIFGVEFSEIIKRKNETDLCPIVFQQLITYLHRKGVDCQGIFRINGTDNEIKKLQATFDSGKTIDLEHYTDVPTIASCFKLLIRKMPTPILTYELYSNFLEVSEIKNEQERLKEYKNLLNQLSPQNRYCLGLLLELLYKISLNSNNNMMSPNNLGICFGPNILRTQDPNPLIFARDNGKILTTCQHLIEFYPKLKDLFNDQSIKQAKEEQKEKNQPRTRTQSNAPTLNEDNISERFRSLTSPSLQQPNVKMNSMQNLKPMKRVVEDDKKHYFSPNSRVSFASMIVENYCEPDDMNDQQQQQQQQQQNITLNSSLQSSSSFKQKKDLPPLPRKLSMIEKMKILEEKTLQEEEKLMIKQISDSILYLPDTENDEIVTLTIDDENKKKEIYFYLTNIFCTKEKPFEVFCEGKPFFTCTGSIKKDDVVLLQENFSNDTETMVLYIKMPIRGIIETKTLSFDDGQHILIECQSDSNLKIIQNTKAHTILL
eukprot:gene1618-12743_t